MQKKTLNQAKVVSIVGASGYVGAELCALLSGHPKVRLVGLFSNSEGEPKTFESLHPALVGKEGPSIQQFEIKKLLADSPDCVFLATPSEVSAELVPLLLEKGITVIDLSGAYRLKTAEQYLRWYGFSHPQPTLLAEAIYGLTEWCCENLNGTRLIANPGCYPTSVLLALKPLSAIIDFSQPLICDCKSGVSGAGKRKDFSYSFGEISDNFKAYCAGVHRHEVEIRQELGLPAEAPFLFVPHLLPVFRGIFSTIYVTLQKHTTAEEITETYSRAYCNSTFVRVRPEGKLPELKDVAGTPRVEIGFILLANGRRMVIVSVLDNLLKGAASQAVQNFNWLFGFDETEGLA